MLPILNFNENEILAFALILLRVSAFVVSWPVFSVYSVPNQVKVLFSVLLALVLFPTINRQGLEASSFGNEIVWLAGKEVLAGLCLGFLTRLFFFAVSIGGNLIATSIGLSNAQIFNPTLNTQSTVVEQFYVTVATLLFLALNGHHTFIMGLVQSFDAIPLSPVGIEIAVFKESGTLLQLVLEAGIKIAAPVMVAIFFMNVALGIIGRAVPQMNVLVTGLAVNFIAGILVMIVSIPALVLQLDHDIFEFTEQVFRIIKAL